MSKVFIFLCVVLFSSCNQNTTKEVDNISAYYGAIRIDGCQYITYDSGDLDNRVFAISHKGNCDNPIHNK